jgi:polyisoprenoid-binding protein YceI
MRKLLGLVFAGAIVAAASAADSVKLTGENTKIEFTGTKTDGKHVGGFKKLEGTASTEKIEVTIEIDSMWSDDDKLTAHLKGADFFDVKSNPTAKFVTSKIEKTDDGHKVTGEFTLNGKTKEISFPAKISSEGGEFKLDAEFKIDRTEFGMSYGKGKIDDLVALKVSVKAKS